MLKDKIENIYIWPKKYQNQFMLTFETHDCYDEIKT